MINYLIASAKVILPFMIPSALQVGTHLVCENFGCEEWYSLLGFNLACNACIDAKKLLKDQQVNMYWSIGSILVSKIDCFISNEIPSKGVLDN